MFFVLYTLWGIKKRGSKLSSVTLANLNDFDKFFTPIAGNKFVTKCIHLLTYLF